MKSVAWTAQQVGTDVNGCAPGDSPGSADADPPQSMAAPASQRLLEARGRVMRLPNADGLPVDLCDGSLGLGVVARRRIRPGELILRFGGPSVTFAEAVAMGDDQCYTLQVAPDRYIDLDEPGRYVNHSCDPNTGVVQLHLVALRPIHPGEEVRFDYSTTMDEDHWEIPCLCGSPSCRGRIADFKHVDPPTRRRYLQLGIVMSFIARQHEC
jgi:hypothetical protein